MYAILSHNNLATYQDIIDNIVALVTGTTDPALLPGATNGSNANGPVIDVLGSSIDVSSTGALNWTVFDNNSDDDSLIEYGVVLRSPIADAPTVYKYLKLTGTTLNIEAIVYEDWEPISHSGTNEARSISISQNIQRWEALGNFGNIHIHASDRHILINSSFNGARVGPIGITEFTRRSIWDTVSNGFPPFMQIRFYAAGLTITGSLGNIPRTLDGIFNVAAINAPVYMQSLFAGNNIVNWENMGRTVDANRDIAHALVPFGCSNYLLSHEGGDISSLTDIYLASSNEGSFGTEIIVGANTYIVWQAGNTQTDQRLAVRKG